MRVRRDLGRVGGAPRVQLLRRLALTGGPVHRAGVALKHIGEVAAPDQPRYSMWQTMPGYVKFRCAAKSTRGPKTGAAAGTPGITDLCFFAGGRANRRCTLRFVSRARAATAGRKVIHRGGGAKRVDTGPSQRVPMIHHHNFTQRTTHSPVDNSQLPVESFARYFVFLQVKSINILSRFYPQVPGQLWKRAGERFVHTCG